MNRGANEPAPAVVVRGSRKGESAWLNGDALLWEQEGLRRRIPLVAVEELRGEGEGTERTVEVTLTAGAGEPATVYRLEGVGTAAASRFVDVVGGVLPDRGPEAARPDGARLVRVVERLPGTGDKQASARWRAGLVFLGVFAVYVGGMVLLGVERDAGRVILWALSPMVVMFGLAALAPAVHSAWIWPVLRRRGVSVMATHDRWVKGKRVCTFVDLEGTTREIRPGVPERRYKGDPPQTEIVYDPRRPARWAAHESTGAIVVQTVVYFLIGAPICTAGLLMGPYQLIDLFFLS
jgi:hypothetical protein